MGAAAERIHCAGLDERFQNALVEQAEIDVLAKLVDGFEAAELLARGDDGFDGIAADVLYRSQAEADGFSMRGEVCVRYVDVRGFDGNAHLAALVDVLHHIIGAAGDRSEQRRHELDGIVRLQICRVVGEQGVGGGVRLVESVAGKLRHEIENLLDLLRWKLALGRAFDETLALLRHFSGIFLAHGAAQQIGLAERVAGEAVGDLHDLFLVDDYTQRFLKNFF